MKHAVPAMRKRGAGSIINISSIFGLVGSSGSAVYHGTKGDVRPLSKAAAIEYAPDKIRVNSVHPGITTSSRALSRSHDNRRAPNPRLQQQEAELGILPTRPVEH